MGKNKLLVNLVRLYPFYFWEYIPMVYDIVYYLAQKKKNIVYYNVGKINHSILRALDIVWEKNPFYNMPYIFLGDKWWMTHALVMVVNNILSIFSH